MSLIQRLSLLVLFVVAFSASITWFVIKPNYEQALIEEKIAKLSQFHQQVTSDVDQQVEYYVKIIQDLAKNMDSQNLDATSVLSTYIRIFPELQVVKLTELKSNEYILIRQKNATPIGLYEEWKIGALPLKAASGIQINWINASNLLFFYAQIQANSKDYDIELVIQDNSIVNKVKGSAIADNNRVLLAYGQHIILSTYPEGEPIYINEPSEVIDTKRVLTYAGPVIRATGLFRILPYSYTIEIAEFEITGQIHTLLYQTLLILVLSSLFVLLGSSFLIHYLNKPIQKLINFIKPMGEFDFTIPITPVGLPELNPISTALDRIRVQLLRYQRINVENLIIEQSRNKLLMTKASEMIAILDEKDEIEFKNDRLTDFLEEINLSKVTKWSEFLGYDKLEYKILNREVDEHDNFTLIHQHSEYRCLTPNSNMYYFRVHQLDLMIQGTRKSSLVVLVDLTKEMELDVKRNQMISFIVHELKNPLSAILGFSQLAHDSSHVREIEKKYMDYVIGSAKEMNSLITRFLEISKLESQTSVISKSMIFIPGIIQQLEESFALQMREKNITFSINIDNNYVFFEGNELLFTDAIRNIISNAIKYGDNDRSISIELKKQDDYVGLSVTDYGYGIPQKSLAKIFDKFYRVKRHADIQGTGLGLAYVQEIMKKHNGKVLVESAPEFGSKFSLLFPISEFSTKK